MNIFKMLGYCFICSRINVWIIYSIFLIIIQDTYIIKPCTAAENEINSQIINAQNLRSLQKSYNNLISFPQQKLKKLEEGKALVEAFNGLSSNFAELMKVIDIDKNQTFISNIISQKNKNITQSPGMVVSTAIENMRQSDDLNILVDMIEEFKHDIKIHQADKVIGYALSQISIDNESKKISKIVILPQNLNPKNPNAAFLLLTSKEFTQNITNKIANTISDTSITKLPLIRDVNKIIPIEDPKIIAYRPFLYQYFTDRQGELLTNDKQINNNAKELLPQADASSLHNARASMQLLNSVIYMNNSLYNSNRNRSKIKNHESNVIRKWIEDSIDSFWVKRGELRYNFFQKEGNKSFGRFVIKSTINSFGADEIFRNIFLRFCYGYCKSKTVDKNLGKTTINTNSKIFCLNALYKYEIFIISGYLGHSMNTNIGYRIDKQYLQHHHKNNSRLSTVNINVEALLVLDRIWSFYPGINLTFSQYHSNKYQENSAYIESKLFDSEVNPNNYNSSLLGAQIAIKGLFIHKDIKYQPKFLFALNYNFGDKKNSLDIKLHGAKTTLYSNPIDPLNFLFSIETAISGKSISSSIKYTLQVCEQFNSNIISFEVNYCF